MSNYSWSERKGCLLDDNQKYDLLRRCVISYFAKDTDRLNELGYFHTDFHPTMKLLSSMYFEYCKNKENI